MGDHANVSSPTTKNDKVSELEESQKISKPSPLCRQPVNLELRGVKEPGVQEPRACKDQEAGTGPVKPECVRSRRWPVADPGTLVTS